jgi:hypothetical protein
MTNIDLNNVLGYYQNDFKKPIAYMNSNGILVFSDNEALLSKNLLGGNRELHSLLSNLDYYRLNGSLGRKQTGGGGFFGESNGKCGWGDSPSCCFFGCEPLWKTNVWPFDITM